MDLSTSYLGFKLPHPIIPGPGPLTDDFDSVRRLEDAGAPMIILRSLFEEQIEAERDQMLEHLETTAYHGAEARSYLPDPPHWKLGPVQYLEYIQKIKRAVAIPVVASLNGDTNAGWLDYAQQIEEAGADALELNVYLLSTDMHDTGAMIESRVISILESVRHYVKIPVAVKISEFYSSLPNFAKQLDDAGADALVLFNRFYQPDIDTRSLEVVPSLNLSSSSELLLRLRWTAILSGRIDADLALTGGVHTAEDVIKSLMCGACCVQVVSALLQRGPAYLRLLKDGLKAWMERHEYESVRQMTGSMSLVRSPNPGAFERANYARILQTWHV